MTDDVFRQLLKPSTPDEARQMLVILATSTWQALQELPDNEENESGITTLKTGCTLALYQKEKNKMSLEEFWEEIYKGKEKP